jgi:selenocysteine lyase/cysteine desulfurase
VRDAIEMYRRALDENPVVYLQSHGSRLDAAVRSAAATYLGTSPRDIALTDSTTMGLGLLYNGIDLRRGQEALTTTHDFFATHRSLQLKAARTGATVRVVPLYRQLASVTAEEIVETLNREIAANTRVVAVTWVHSSTGLRLPIRLMADAVAAINAGRDERDHVLLCVDGVHGLGVENIVLGSASEGDGEVLGCDFFVAGCHKWLFGPRGTGIIWGKSGSWPAVRPTIPSFGDDGSPGGAMTPGGFHSFEHRWALAQAFDLHRQIGKARIAGRIHDLNRQLKDGLAAMPHVTLYTPREDGLSAGLVCFDVKGMSPGTVVRRLGERRIVATTTPYSPSHARLAAGLLNTPDEVEATLQAIRAFS